MPIRRSYQRQRKSLDKGNKRESIGGTLEPENRILKDEGKIDIGSQFKLSHDVRDQKRIIPAVILAFERMTNYYSEERIKFCTLID